MSNKMNCWNVVRYCVSLLSGEHVYWITDPMHISSQFFEKQHGLPRGFVCLRINHAFEPRVFGSPVQLSTNWPVARSIGRELNVRARSIGRELDGRSKDPRFEPCQKHKKICWEFLQVKNVVLNRCRCAQPLCVYTRIRMITYAGYISCSLHQSSVDYGNKKRQNLHL